MYKNEKQKKNFIELLHIQTSKRTGYYYTFNNTRIKRGPVLSYNLT